MASKRRLRRKACEGKVRFDDKDEAHKVRALMNRGRPSLQKVQVYGCKFGQHWHVGHRPASQRRAAEAKRRSQ